MNNLTLRFPDAVVLPPWPRYDSRHADLLSDFGVDTVQGRGKHGVAHLCRSSGCRAGAVSTVILGSRIGLGDKTFVESTWHRLVRNVPAGVTPALGTCIA